MRIFQQWPPKLQRFLLDSYGAPTEITKLSGIKAAGGSFRLSFSDCSIIVKMASPQEYWFYNNCSRYGAITMPGLGSSDNSLEKLLAQRYLHLWSQASIEFPLSETELVQQIKLAKLWSVVEFLYNSHTVLDKAILQKLKTDFVNKLLALN